MSDGIRLDGQGIIRAVAEQSSALTFQPELPLHIFVRLGYAGDPMSRHYPTLHAALSLAAIVGTAVAAPCSGLAAPGQVLFAQSANTVEAYNIVEITARVSAPDAANPFIDATLTGWFERADGNRRWTVEGFCDAEDGSAERDL